MSRWAADRLYTDAMFHGPAWRGVNAVEQTGATGTVARLRVLPFDRFLRGSAPRFVLDPVMLDAAGQVIGFWTMEHLDSGKVIFPYHVDAIELYGAHRASGDMLTCTASIQLVGEQQVRSDIDVIGSGGRVWMRLLGWEDKRFDLPERFYPLILSPRQTEISSVWAEPAAQFPQPRRFACRAVPPLFRTDRAFWKSVWAQCILGRSEREQFRALRTPEHRQLEWLAARHAAKEAVRHLLRAADGPDLPLADIEIRSDDQGRPLVDGAWRHLVAGLPVISLAHTDGWGVALAGLVPGEETGVSGTARIGIDIERLRSLPDGFEDISFTAEEQQLLCGLPDDKYGEWVFRCWCAKEAVGKALGRGLIEGPRSVSIASVDADREIVIVHLTGELAASHPELAAVGLMAHTSRHDDLIVAATLCEPINAVVASSASGLTT